MRISVAARMGVSVSLLASAVLTSVARADTLSDAVALAYANNPNIIAQRAALAAVDEGYVQARSAYGPHLQASAGENYEQVQGKYYGGQTGQSAHLANDSGSLGLNLTQTLYSGGRNHAAVSAAEASILSQRETLRLTETQVLQQVVAAYVAVRRDMGSLDISRDNVQALRRQLEQIEAEFAVRQVTRTDVEETRGRVALAQANLANAQAQLDISRSQYLQLVGESPADLAPEPDLAVPPNVDRAFDISEDDSPQLGAARYQEQLARARVAEARANYLPSVTAQVDYARTPIQTYSSTLGEQTAVTGSVTLTQPLFESGLYGSQVRQALAQDNQARAQVEVARRIVVQSVSQAWGQLAAARTSLVADETGVQATQAAFYGVRREQLYDLRQPIDVLNAEEEFNNAQIRLLQDRYNEYVARVNLLGAIGLLDAQMLAPGTPVIAPERSFNAVKNKGATPLTDVLQTLDSIGLPGPAPAKPAVRDGRPKPISSVVLPPAPVPAADVPPMVTATSVIKAEDATRPATDPAAKTACDPRSEAMSKGCVPEPKPQPLH